jgi:sigma-B regulation protein RsbU (phosphoserine phosphatase)
MSSQAGSGAEDQLHDLQVLTEAALGRLGIDQLLSELLERVRDIAQADTVAVLLLNERSQMLVARAACGIEEEVREGVQVPVGVGFAGRVAQQRSPVLLNQVDPSTVANPILWESGIKVMLGVPLLAGQRVIGVLHVGRLENHPFSTRDARLLEVVAERIAGAVQRRLLDEERAAASLFERSLLLERMPACPGLEFAARYLTPEDRSVGGDWYDVFTLPSGELWLVAGDVAGHGLASAVVMGRLRSALRSYALLGGSPEEVLELTHRKARHFEMGTMATIVCACSKPPYRDWRITTAGHPPPVLAVPGQRASLLELPVDPPIGVGPEIGRSSSTVAVPDGAVMLLYTDGLVERRGESLDEGFNRLCECVRPDHPEIILHQVLQSLIGTTPPVDDVVVVAIRRVRQLASGAAVGF